MNKWVMKCREGLISVLENESLFLLAAFLLRGILFVDPLKWHMEEMTRIYTYMLCPWGGLLIGLRLFRVHTGETKAGTELPLLFLLFAWIVFPLLFRFGATFNNAVTDIGYAIVFFGLYASLRERPEHVRRRRFFEMGVLFSALAIVWGGLLLYCAFTGIRFGQETGGTIFGVQKGILYGGVHYNTVGMMAIGCLYMGIGLFEGSDRLIFRVLGVLASAVMILVIILAQSRSCRYAMLIAFAFGSFVRVLYLPFRNRIFQKGIAFVCAVCVLVGGYFLSSMLMNLALTHYARLSAGKTQTTGVVEQDTVAHEERMIESGDLNVTLTPEYAESDSVFVMNLPVSGAKAEGDMTGKARVAVDATFSDRTNVWRNLFDLWRSDFKKLLIGRGVGNTGSLIAHDTIHEADGTAAVHNTYLQFVADFGLIGFALQIAFFILILPGVLRGLAAGGNGSARGNLSMGMMAVAILAIGMMESAPLGQMTPANLMLYTSLAFLTAAGDRCSCKKTAD